MVKLLTPTACPNCKHEFKVTSDLDKMEFKDAIDGGNPQASGQNTQQIEKPVETPKPEVKIETVIEDFKPNYECPNGNCDIGVHKNKNFKKRPKGKCTNCNQFTKHDKGTCPWCKSTDIEALDPEELDELGIDIPTEQEHDHEHE